VVSTTQHSCPAGKLPAANKPGRVRSRNLGKQASCSQKNAPTHVKKWHPPPLVCRRQHLAAGKVGWGLRTLQL
jgi:hypothetical protein